MSKYVRETAPAKSVSATVIMKGARHVATVQAHYGSSRVLVNVWQESEAYRKSFTKAHNAPTTDSELDRAAYELFAFQQGTASGYGYDKFAAALSGLIIDGHTMGNHCEFWRKPPKGRATFPETAKAPKGWSFANWTRWSKSRGKSMHAYDWRDMAKAELFPNGLPENDAGAWDSIHARANELEAEWRESDDCESGYSDCYRATGLDYLRAIGYSLINAI